MLAYIKGTVAYKDLHGAIIEAGGIGYEVSLTATALSALPQAGEQANVWTYLQVKDDGFSLFGFADLAEKEMFLRLIGVSGVGPKIALAALSTFRSRELSAIIAEGDITRLATVSGLGKKTAQRIVLELQGILKEEASLFNQDAAPQAAASQSEAFEALESMGFTHAEVAASLKGCDSNDTAELIKYALRNMGGRS